MTSVKALTLIVGGLITAVLLYVGVAFLAAGISPFRTGSVFLLAGFVLLIVGILEFRKAT